MAEHIMKKLMVLIVGGILSAALPLAAEEQTVNGVTWSYYLDDDIFDIKGAVPATGHLTIPSTLGGRSVTSIGDFAFQDCSDLTSVTIPNSVTNIKYAAFAGCSGLTSVTIPSSVTSIGNDAFGSCTGLTRVTIPQSGVDRFYRIFEDCRNLAVVKISDGVTHIGEEAFVDFYGYGSLKSVTIPNSVTNIGSWAFSGCSGLTSVKIPNKVKHIEYGAFRHCSGLRSVSIPNGVTYIGKEAFSGCSGLTSVSIPNSVTNIGEGAFSDCSGLTSMTIPNSVMYIGNRAFSYCTNLTSVTLSQLGVNRFGSIFPHCRNTVVEISDGVTHIGEYAFGECDGLRIVKIPNSVTSIEYRAFCDCSGLTDVIFKGNAPTLGSYAFSGVKNGCTVYVRENSSGWGVDIPGTWNGLNIRFLTPEVEFAVANEMGGGTVELGGELSTVEVASGVTLVVRGENLDAAALAAKITPKPHEEEQSAALFKVATSTAAGFVSLSVVLDEDAIDPDETAREIISAANMVAFGAAADGTTVSVPLSSAKPGLYYGIAAVSDLSQMEEEAANAPLVRADAGGVTVPVVKPVGSSAFFKVIVSDRAW